MKPKCCWLAPVLLVVAMGQARANVVVDDDLGLHADDLSTGNAGATYVDTVASGGAVRRPADANTSGTYTTQVIEPASFSGWKRAYFKASGAPGQGQTIHDLIGIEVLDGLGESIDSLPWIASDDPTYTGMVDLSSIGVAHPQIRLRFTLTNGAINPALDSWKVTWTPYSSLSISYSAPDFVCSGASIAHQIRVSVSYVTARNVLVTLPLATGVGPVPDGQTPASFYGATRLVWQSAVPGSGGQTGATPLTLPSGQTVPAYTAYFFLGDIEAGHTFQVLATTISPLGTISDIAYALTATARSSNADLVNSSAVTTTVRNGPSPVITKRAVSGVYRINQKDYAVPGTPVTFAITIQQPWIATCRADYYNVAVWDPLTYLTTPSNQSPFVQSGGAFVVTGIDGGGAYTNIDKTLYQNDSNPIDVPAQSVYWTIPKLAVGEAKTFRYTVQLRGTDVFPVPDDGVEHEAFTNVARSNTGFMPQQSPRSANALVYLHPPQTPVGIYRKGDIIRGSRSASAANNDNPYSSVTYGERVGWLLAVDNGGFSTLRNHWFFDRVPEHTSLLSVSAPTGATIYYATELDPDDESAIPGYDRGAFDVGDAATAVLDLGTWSETPPAVIGDTTWIAVRVPEIGSAFRQGEAGVAPSTALVEIMTTVDPPGPGESCAEFTLDNAGIFETLSYVGTDQAEHLTSLGGIDHEAVQVRPILGSFELASISATPNVRVGPGPVTFEVRTPNVHLGGDAVDTILSPYVQIRLPEVSVNGVVTALQTLSVDAGPSAYYVDASSPGWVYVEWPSQLPNEQKVVKVTVQVPRGVLDGQVLTARADFYGEDDACEPITGRATVSASVIVKPHLKGVKQTKYEIVAAAAGITNEYPLTYANIGDAAARGSLIADKLPSQMRLVDVLGDAHARIYFSKRLAPDVPATEQDWNLTEAQILAAPTVWAPAIDADEDEDTGFTIWQSPFGEQTTWVVALTDDIELEPPQLPTFAGGDLDRVIVRARVADGTEPGTVITNRAVVAANDLLRAVTNQVRLVVAGIAGLEIERTCGPDVVAGGESIALHSHYLNNSTNQDLTAHFTETLPANAELEYVEIHIYDDQGVEQTPAPIYAEDEGVIDIDHPHFGPLWTADITVHAHLVGVSTGDTAFFEAAATADNDEEFPVFASGSCAVLVANPDLVSTKLVNIARPVASDIVTFTVTLSNIGAHATNGLVVVDELDAGFAFAGNVFVLTPGWSFAGDPESSVVDGKQRLEWSTAFNRLNYLGDDALPGNTSVTFQYEAQITETLPGKTFQNCVRPRQQDPAFAEDDTGEFDDNDACVSVTTPYPDLYVLKTGPTDALGNDIVRFQLHYGNRSRQAATQVFLVDKLPNWAGDGQPPAGPGTPDGKADVEIVGVIPQNSETIRYSSSPLTSPAPTADNGSWGPKPSVDTNWIAIETPSLGGVQFEGEHTVFVDVRLKNPRNHILPRPGAQFVNCATIASGTQDDAANDNGPSCATTVVPGADVSVDKTCGAPCMIEPTQRDIEGGQAQPDPTCIEPTAKLRPGDQVQVFLSAENSGTDNVFAIRLRDTFPSELEVQTVELEAIITDNGGEGHAIDAEGDLINDTLYWTPTSDGWVLGTTGASDALNYQRVGLEPGGAALLRITASVKRNVLNDTIVLNNATIVTEQTGARAEEYLVNNHDDCELRIYRPDVKLEKTVTDAHGGQGPAGVGTALHYTITYNNVGMALADDMKIVDVVPQGTVLVPASFSVLPSDAAVHFYDADGVELEVIGDGELPDPRIASFEIVFGEPASAPMTESFFETANFAGDFDATADIGGAVVAASNDWDANYTSPPVPDPDDDDIVTGWGLVNVNGGGPYAIGGTEEGIDDDDPPLPAAPGLGSGLLWVTVRDYWTGDSIPGYFQAVVNAANGGTIDISGISPADHPRLKVQVMFPPPGGPADTLEPQPLNALGGSAHGEVWFQNRAFAYGLTAGVLDTNNDGPEDAVHFERPVLTAWVNLFGNSWFMVPVQTDSYVSISGIEDPPPQSIVDHIYWGSEFTVVTHDKRTDAYQIWKTDGGDWDGQWVSDVESGYFAPRSRIGEVRDVAGCDEYNWENHCQNRCGGLGCAMPLFVRDNPVVQIGVALGASHPDLVVLDLPPSIRDANPTCSVKDINQHGIVVGTCDYNGSRAVLAWVPSLDSNTYGAAEILENRIASQVELGGLDKNDVVVVKVYQGSGEEVGWRFGEWHYSLGGIGWQFNYITEVYGSAALAPARPFNDDMPGYAVVHDGNYAVLRESSGYYYLEEKAGQVDQVKDTLAVGSFGTDGMKAVEDLEWGEISDLPSDSTITQIGVLSATAVTGVTADDRRALWDASTFFGESWGAPTYLQYGAYTAAGTLWPTEGGNDENGTTGTWPNPPGDWQNNSPIVWQPDENDGYAGYGYDLDNFDPEGTKVDAMGGIPGVVLFGRSTRWSGQANTMWTYSGGDYHESPLVAYGCDTAEMQGVTPDGVPYGICGDRLSADPIAWRVLGSGGWTALHLDNDFDGITLGDFDGWSDRFGGFLARTGLHYVMPNGGGYPREFHDVSVLYLDDGFGFSPLVMQPYDGDFPPLYLFASDAPIVPYDREGDLISVGIFTDDGENDQSVIPAVYRLAGFGSGGAGATLEILDPFARVSAAWTDFYVHVAETGDVVAQLETGPTLYRYDEGSWVPMSLAPQGEEDSWFAINVIGRGPSTIVPETTTRVLIQSLDNTMMVVEVDADGAIARFDLGYVAIRSYPTEDGDRAVIHAGYLVGADYDGAGGVAFTRTASGYTRTVLTTDDGSPAYVSAWLGKNVFYGGGYGQLQIFVNEPDGSTNWRVQSLPRPFGLTFDDNDGDIALELSDRGVGVVWLYGDGYRFLYALVPGNDPPSEGSGEAPSITPGQYYHYEDLDILASAYSSTTLAGNWLGGECWVIGDGMYYWGCGMGGAGGVQLEDLEVTFASGDPSFTFTTELQETCNDTIDNRALVSTATPEITTSNNEGIATIAVKHADLDVSLAVDKSVAANESSLTWDVLVTNNGPDAADNVRLDFTYPSDVAPNEQPVVLIGRLEAGQSFPWTFTGMVGAPDEGTALIAAVSVKDTDDFDYGPDCNPGNDTASVTTIAGDFPNLWIQKACPTSAPIGSVITCTITYGNDGNRPAYDVVAVDTLPPGAVPYGAEQPLELDIGLVNPGVTDSYEVQYLVSGCGLLGDEAINLVHIEAERVDAEHPPDANAFDNDAAATTLLLPSEGRLAVSLFASRATAEVDDYVTFTAEYAATGSQDVHNAVVSIALPTHASVVSTSLGGVTGASDVSWTFPTLRAGESGTVAIVAKVMDGPTVASSVAISGDGICPIDPPSEVEVLVPEPGLHLVKSADRHVVCGENEDVRWSIVVSNTGALAVDDLVVTDVVPAGLALAGDTLAGLGVDVSALPTIRWNIGHLAAGQGLELGFTTTAPTSDGELVTNVAHGTYRVGAVSAAIDSNEVPVRVQCSAIALEKAWDAACNTPGAPVTAVIHWANHTEGPLAIVITDPVPGFTGVTATANGNVSGGVVTWTLGTVAVGASGTVSWTGTPSGLVSGDIIGDTAIATAPGALPQTSNAVSAVVLICPNDTEVCTAAACDPGLGCFQAPVAGTCDDGNVCTDNDHCELGHCVAEVRDCADDDMCTHDFCDPTLGCQHENEGATLCDDGIPCTTDACNAETGCESTPSDVACDDENACTADTCNPDAGDANGCVYEVLTEPPGGGEVTCGTGACGNTTGTITCVDGQESNTCDPAYGDVVDTSCTLEKQVVYAIVNDKAGQPVGTIRCTRTVTVDTIVTDCDRSDDTNDDPLTLKVYDGLMCPGTEPL